MSTNKWENERQYVPGRKQFTLAPLNLEAIRNELQQDSSYSEDSDTDDDNPGNKMGAILNKSFNDGTPPKSMEKAREDAKEVTVSNCAAEPDNDNKKQEVCNQGANAVKECLGIISVNKKVLKNTPLKFGKPCQKQLSYNNFLETVPENPIDSVAPINPLDLSLDASTNNKENICDNGAPLNLSREKCKNDSFDLDFTALSIHTPLKKKEKVFNYVTPKINIIPPSVNKSERPIFKTPITSNKCTFSKPLFKTPISKPLLPIALYSGKTGQLYSRGTPVRLSNQSDILAELSESPKNTVPKPVICTSDDGFDRICVNGVEYVILKMLGKGGSSEVFYGFNKEQHLDVAIKLVSLTDYNTREGYVNEVKLLVTLQNCDRIIKLYDYEIRDEKLLIVLEKCGEDLNTILKQLAMKKSQLPTHMLLFYWMEMLYAVKQIHSKGVIHSDLKPANFLRSEGGLKLIDFGIASKVQDDMTCVYKSSQEGSCNYISPEALSQQTCANADSPNYGKPKYKIHFKSDVWSLGCILYQLVYRITPFQHVTQMWAKLAAITDPAHKIKFPQNHGVSPRILSTVKRCLRYDAKARPSVDELILEYEELLKIIGNVDT